MQLSFSINGDFVTNTARQWFWDEGKEYEICEELLLNCLITDELTLEERKNIARDIIEGKKKIEGISTDGFTVENDGIKIRPLSDKIKTLEKEKGIETIQVTMFSSFMPFVDPFSRIKSPDGFWHAFDIDTYQNCYEYFLTMNNPMFMAPSLMEEKANSTTKGGLWLIEHADLVYDVLSEIHHTTNMETLRPDNNYYDTDCFWYKLYEKIKDWDDTDIKDRNNKYLAMLRNYEIKEQRKTTSNITSKEEEIINDIITKTEYDKQIKLLAKNFEMIENGSYGETAKENKEWYRLKYEVMTENCPKTLHENSDDLIWYILPDTDEMINPCGLVSPAGEWYSCGFAGHNAKAEHFIVAHPEKWGYLDNETLRKLIEPYNWFNDSSALDFLIKDGWCAVRLFAHSGNSILTPLDLGVSKNITKAQKDKIWDVIIKFDLKIETNKLI